MMHGSLQVLLLLFFICVRFLVRSCTLTAFEDFFIFLGFSHLATRHGTNLCDFDGCATTAWITFIVLLHLFSSSVLHANGVLFQQMVKTDVKINPFWRRGWKKSDFHSYTLHLFYWSALFFSWRKTIFWNGSADGSWAFLFIAEAFCVPTLGTRYTTLWPNCKTNSAHSSVST